ncbi:hypothetical protein A9Q87_11225 [Flavobacteriales bacterium 34_180_T64]|nr:hypothetical protein A9Q87_11225 [Flavobacteriales bacterium 34_180_T64]
MKFKDSRYSELLKHSKIEFPFGEFYLCDKFVIAELYEGIHFNWYKIEQVVDILREHYGDTIKIGYISNRINSYSIDPKLWVDFQEQYGFIVASAIVTFNEFGYMNATIEKRFSEPSLKRCINLDEAINWIKNLKEFN